LELFGKEKEKKLPAIFALGLPRYRSRGHPDQNPFPFLFFPFNPN
jgi:hypothetical protein